MLGLFYSLSQDCHFVIDHQVSTTFFTRPFSFSIISNTGCRVAGDGGILNLTYGWWVLILSIATRQALTSYHLPTTKLIALSEV